MKRKLNEDDSQGLYICDREDRKNIVVFWTGQTLQMANVPGGNLPLEYFSNFRRLIEENSHGDEPAAKDADSRLHATFAKN